MMTMSLSVVKQWWFFVTYWFCSVHHAWNKTVKLLSKCAGEHYCLL